MLLSSPLGTKLVVIYEGMSKRRSRTNPVKMVSKRLVDAASSIPLRLVDSHSSDKSLFSDSSARSLDYSSRSSLFGLDDSEHYKSKKDLKRELKTLQKLQEKSFRHQQALGGMGVPKTEEAMRREKARAVRLRRASAAEYSRSSSKSLVSVPAPKAMKRRTTSGDVVTTIQRLQMEEEQMSRSLPATPHTISTISTCSLVEGEEDDYHHDHRRLNRKAENLDLPTLVSLASPAPSYKGAKKANDPAVPAPASKVIPLSKMLEKQEGKKVVPVQDQDGSTAATVDSTTRNEDDHVNVHSNSILDSTAEEEESIRLLQEKIQMLQGQLETTQQEEEKQIQEERAKCWTTKEAVEQMIRQEDINKAGNESFSWASLMPETTEEQRQDLLDTLQAENDARRKESQNLNYQLVALDQVNKRLEIATLKTRQFVRELRRGDFMEAFETNQKLSDKFEACQKEELHLQDQLVKTAHATEMEHKVAKIYNHGMDDLIAFFHAKRRHCHDENVLYAISDLPVVKVRRPGPRKSRRQRA